MFKTEELCLTFFQERIKGQTRNLRWCPKLQNSRFLFYIFLKISKEIGKAWRKSLTREACETREKNRIFTVYPRSHSPFSASFQAFCLTVRAYLNLCKNTGCFAV